MRKITEQNRVEEIANINRELFGKKIGLFGTLFGCWHGSLSMPFSYEGNSYRVCLKCGARKKFDTKSLTTSREFYYPTHL